ncbi:hypothetical protein Fot_22446 [Forsythia ovata]|uniref:Uncharacterized protein n=1 Tax=Forsythia ovata TaxID=205694 RepID=A0ABD1UXR0_9LAMI
MAGAKFTSNWCKVPNFCTSFTAPNTPIFAPDSHQFYNLNTDPIREPRASHFHQQNCTSNWCNLHQLCGAQCTIKLVQNAPAWLVQNSPATGAKSPIFAPVSPHQMPPILHQICTNFATSTPTPSSTTSLAFRG